MAKTTVLERLQRKLGDQQKRAAATYLEAVREIADGREPDADSLATVLRETGKTLEQLASDVETVKLRRRWADQAAAVPALQAELAEHQAAIAKANAELEAAERRYEEITTGPAWECQRIQDELAAADRAKDSLAKSCLDGEALGELAAAREELQAKREERFELHNQRQRKQKALADVRDALASFKPIHEADRELWQREAAELEGELAELDKVEAGLNQAVAKLEAAETAAAERLLVP
jgi:flagellar biosynthesis chaperone FliJ